jgi:signal transduction histidine kinase
MPAAGTRTTIEAGLHALLDHGSPGAALQDADGRYVFVTRDFAEAHGLPTETMLGATDAELLGPAAVSARAAADREALASGRARFEYTVDGARAVCGDVLDLASETGGTAGFGVVLRAVEHEDLHPAGELRKRLHDAERRGRIGSWEWDLRTGLVLFSEELARIYGRDHDGQPLTMEECLDHQHPGDREMVARRMREAVHRGEPFAFEHRIITSGSRLRWMHCQGLLETDARGRPVWVRGTDQDVTERRVVRDQLTRLHRRSQHILESVSEGIVGLDRLGHITFINDAALRMLDRTRAQLLDLAFDELVTGADDPPQADEQHPILATLADGHERHIERGHVHQADGALLAVDFTCTALKQGRRIEGVVVALRDRSLRERYELEITEAMAALSASDAHRRRLLADTVAAQEHERRRIAGEIHDDAVQAMSAVALRAEQLAGSLDSVAAGQLHRLLEVVRDATGRLRQMLVQLQPPELDTAIGPAIEAYVISSALPFDHVLDDRLTQEPSRETRVVLYRIAQEALRNAAKHAGATTVRTELVDTDAVVRLTVADDGRGVAGEEILRGSQPGHLGVDTMRYRAELAGGRCTITSVPGAGTTVAVELPRQEHG